MPGTIHEKIRTRLGDFQPYRDFSEGRMSREGYVAVLNSVPESEHVSRFSLNEDQFHLSGRRPPDETGFVDGILSSLVSAGILPHSGYDKSAFEEFRNQVNSRYFHGDKETYIFPEEERLVYALASILKPESLGFFGSYYGYWGIWALPHLGPGGNAVFLDSDPAVCAIASENLSRFGFEGVAEIRCEDAVAYLRREDRRYDFALVDAEGPARHADIDYSKKRIYYPIFDALKERLFSGGLVSAHNILLKNSHPDDYFARKIVENLSQFDKLLPLVGSHFGYFDHFETSEGVGLFGALRT